MIELLPDTIYEYCKEQESRKRVVVFCPTDRYRRMLMQLVFRKNPELFVWGRPNTLLYPLGPLYVYLHFLLPDSTELMGMHPDMYYVFEGGDSFPEQNKRMWEQIKRWGPI
jgi:hypothetical protein